MSARRTNPCPNCKRLRQRVQLLEQTVTSLTEQVRLLQEQLATAAKDSSTSSRPPSSDIVKPPKPTPPPGQARCAAGGQPGHPRHERAPFPPEQINGGVFEHTLDSCPDCGRAVQPLAEAPRVVQQMDLRLLPVVITEHRGQAVWCPVCLSKHHAPLPAAVEAGGLVGPGLTTLIAYLKGVCHASFSTVRRFLRDVVGVTLSRSSLVTILAKVTRALQQPYEELLQALPGENTLNVDETGHKDRGQALWAWCFRAELYTLFKIDPTRSAEVLIGVLGKEFEGVLG